MFWIKSKQNTNIFIQIVQIFCGAYAYTFNVSMYFSAFIQDEFVDKRNVYTLYNKD